MMKKIISKYEQQATVKRWIKILSERGDFEYTSSRKGQMLVNHNGKTIMEFSPLVHMNVVKTRLDKYVASDAMKNSADDIKDDGPHVHFKLMMEYAIDARKTTQPWKLWECKSAVSNSWVSCPMEMCFSSACSYRKKPAYSICNGVKIIKPYRGEVKIGLRVYSATPTLREKATEIIWNNSESNKRLKDMNLIHKSREAAIAHCDAMLIINDTY